MIITLIVLTISAYIGFYLAGKMFDFHFEKKVVILYSAIFALIEIILEPFIQNEALFFILWIVSYYTIVFFISKRKILNENNDMMLHKYLFNSTLMTLLITIIILFVFTIINSQL